MNATFRPQRDAEDSEPVLADRAGTLGHPPVAGAGDPDRRDAPDRRRVHEIVAETRDLLTRRRQQAQPGGGDGLGLHVQVLNREVAHHVQDVAGVLPDEWPGMVGRAVGAALAGEPPQCLLCPVLPRCSSRRSPRTAASASRYACPASGPRYSHRKSAVAMSSGTFPLRAVATPDRGCRTRPCNFLSARVTSPA